MIAPASSPARHRDHALPAHGAQRGAMPFYLSTGAYPLTRLWYVWDDISVLCQ